MVMPWGNAESPAETMDTTLVLFIVATMLKALRKRKLVRETGAPRISLNTAHYLRTMVEASPPCASDAHVLVPGTVVEELPEGTDRQKANLCRFRIVEKA